MKKNGVCYAMLALIVLALLALGCAEKQYAALGQAGTAYGAAMDNLLLATAKLRINSNSEKILTLRRDFMETSNGQLTEQDKPVIIKEYNEYNELDASLLATIEKLRKQTKLLTSYFSALNELATSDAPERAKNAATGLATSMNKFSDALLLQFPQIKTDVAGMVAKLVVSAMIDAQLRQVLEATKKEVGTALAVQQEVLDRLSKMVAKDIKDIQKAQAKRYLLDPLESSQPIAKPDEWVEKRLKILTMPMTIDEMQAASQAAGKLLKAYERILKGELDASEVNSLLNYMEGLVAVAEALNL